MLFPQVDVITSVDLSKKIFGRIRLNYIFAMGYNVLMIPMAAGVFMPHLNIRLPAWAAGLSMAMSSVSVVCSSLLLKRYKPPPNPMSGKLQVRCHITLLSSTPLSARYLPCECLGFAVRPRR